MTQNLQQQTTLLRHLGPRQQNDKTLPFPSFLDSHDNLGIMLQFQILRSFVLVYPVRSEPEFGIFQIQVRERESAELQAVWNVDFDLRGNNYLPTHLVYFDCERFHEFTKPGRLG